MACAIAVLLPAATTQSTEKNRPGIQTRQLQYEEVQQATHSNQVAQRRARRGRRGGRFPVIAGIEYAPRQRDMWKVRKMK